VNGLDDLRNVARSTPTMARLLGVDLPREKRMEIALTYIFGIGRTRAIQTLTATEIDRDKRARELTDEEVVRLRDYI
jgi:small subunit ribosomal protein S13